MNNRKGFTLIELLVTVALIGTIGVIVGVSVNSLMANQKQKSYDEFVANLEEAACVLVQSDSRTEETCPSGANNCKIYLQDLIKYGLVKKTTDNPMTEKSIDEDTTSYVEVTITNGERICKFVDTVCTDC